MVEASKQAELQACAAVIGGELEIDRQGRIWRVAKRGWDRWNQHVRLNKCNRVRAEHRTPLGYLQIRVMIGKVRTYVGAHRLVYRCLVGPIPEGLTINHKNGIKDDNRPRNFELATASQQVRHALDILGVGRVLHQQGEQNTNSKLSNEQVTEIRRRRAMGEQLVPIAVDFGVGYKAISKICRNQRWAHLDSG